MPKLKFADIAYRFVVIIGMSLLSVWLIFMAYLMLHGINNNCPSSLTSPVFPNSYYSPSGSNPAPHVLSGITLVVLGILTLVIVAGNLKSKSRNYKLITLTLIVFATIISVEIYRHISIPSACVFNG